MAFWCLQDIAAGAYKVKWRMGVGSRRTEETNGQSVKTQVPLGGGRKTSGIGWTGARPRCDRDDKPRIAGGAAGARRRIGGIDQGPSGRAACGHAAHFTMPPPKRSITTRRKVPAAGGHWPPESILAGHQQAATTNKRGL